MERKKKDFDKNTTLQKDISPKLLSIQGKIAGNSGDTDKIFGRQFKYEVDKRRKNSISKKVNCRKINN